MPLCSDHHSILDFGSIFWKPCISSKMSYAMEIAQPDAISGDGMGSILYSTLYSILYHPSWDNETLHPPWRPPIMEQQTLFFAIVLRIFWQKCLTGGVIGFAFCPGSFHLEIVGGKRDKFLPVLFQTAQHSDQSEESLRDALRKKCYWVENLFHRLWNPDFPLVACNPFFPLSGLFFLFFFLLVGCNPFFPLSRL